MFDFLKKIKGFIIFILFLLLLTVFSSEYKAQVHVPIHMEEVVATDTTIVDTAKVSEAELFLKDISDKAFVKDEKKKDRKLKLAYAVIAYLLYDKFK